MKQGELFLSVCGTLKDTSSSDVDLTVSTSTEATGQIHTKVCRDCSVELDDTNWATYFKEHDNRTCKSCYNTRHNKKNNVVTNKQRMTVNGKYVSRKHPLWKVGNYKSFNDAAFSSLVNYESSTEGMVYIITNPAWPEWVKIGMAIDAEDRLNGYQTSSPHRDYVLEHYVASNDRRKSEREAHTRALPLASDSKGEWFKLSVEQAITILDNLDEQHRTVIKADKNPQEDELQERPKQTNFWDLTKDFQPS